MKPEQIRELIKLVESSNIDELEVSRFGYKVRIRKSPPSHGGIQHYRENISELPAVREVTVDVAKVESIEEQKYHEIRSPMVGTFYAAPAPDAPPYVKVGDEVKTGQVLCIIEAMKLMNEIEADKNGKIVKILIENAQPVEYNQTLFYIETKE
jgi:acetyl-CoA carboxylase biotin carboxyl carrier protein